jgi:hypothetical protein
MVRRKGAMRKRAVCLLAGGACLLGLLAAIPAQAARVEDFHLYAPLAGSEYGVPVRVVLPPEVLSRTFQALREIKIIDDLGQEIPFLFDVSGSYPRRAMRWEIQDTRTIGDDQIFLLGRGMDGGLVEELTVISGQAWACSDVEVYSSRDGMMWQPLAKGRIASLKPRLDVSWMSIDLSRTSDPLLKVVLRRMSREGGPSPFGCLGGPGGLPDPVPFTAVQGFTSSVAPAGAGGMVYQEERVDRFTGDMDAQGNTVVDLPGPGLPVTEVAFSFAQGCFYRDVSIFARKGGRGTSYDLKGSGGICDLPGLGLSRSSLRADLGSAPGIRLRIAAGGGPPVSLSSITLRWPRTSLLFVPQPGRTYGLYFGTDSPRVGPAGQSYTPGDDVQVFWKAGAPVENRVFKPRRTTADNRRLFFILSVAVLVAYCIGFWAVQIRNLRAGR